MESYELTEAELAELVDNYRDYALAEVTMRVAQTKLLEYLKSHIKHYTDKRNLDWNCFLIDTDFWWKLLKDFRFGGK